jgi:hypothetical protein
MRWKPWEPVAATFALVGLVLLPALAIWSRAILRKSPEARWRLHLVQQVRMLGRGLLESAFRIASLPHEAYWQLDAILRSLWRMTVSRRRLLEWIPSADLGVPAQRFMHRSSWPTAPTAKLCFDSVPAGTWTKRASC